METERHHSESKKYDVRDLSLGQIAYIAMRINNPSDLVKLNTEMNRRSKAYAEAGEDFKQDAEFIHTSSLIADKLSSVQKD